MTQPYPQPYAPPPVQKQRKMWPWIILTGVVALFIGVGIGSSGSKTAPATTGTSASKVTAAPTVAAQPPAQPPAEAKPGPATTFGDGTWVVGEDIQPGTYKSTGARPGIFQVCSVSTHTGDAGDGNVIAWETANGANEPVRIKVDKAGSVKATGCEVFTKV